MFSRLKVHMKACNIPSGYVRFAWLPGQQCFSVKHCGSKAKIHWHHWENAKNVENQWFSLWTLDQVNYWRIQECLPLLFFLERKTHPWFNYLQTPLLLGREEKKNLTHNIDFRLRSYQRRKSAPHCKYCDQVLSTIIGLQFKSEQREIHLIERL